MANFLALGECMVEIGPSKDGMCRRGFAGDTFNTAWYARRLLPDDWTVSYGSCIGDDAVSNAMANYMQNEGIDTKAMRQMPDRTVGLYMISVQDGERSFSYWRGQSAARAMAEDRDWLSEITKGRDIIHFSGITLAILPPEQRQTFCDVMSEARAAGAQIAFDTNLRPKLWGSEEAMREGLTLGASVADIVLPSFDEETELFGDATPEDTITRYRDGGAKLIAVKDGGNPLTVWSEGAGTLKLSPAKVTPVDSTAAGDSFAAGLLASLATGHSLEEAAKRAMALAGQVIQAPGALVPDIFSNGAFA
ncbi:MULTISPECIES: sugar kinase [unclassified Marinovum]